MTLLVKGNNSLPVTPAQALVLSLTPSSLSSLLSGLAINPVSPSFRTFPGSRQFSLRGTLPGQAAAALLGWGFALRISSLVWQFLALLLQPAPQSAAGKQVPPVPPALRTLQGSRLLQERSRSPYSGVPSCLSAPSVSGASSRASGLPGPLAGGAQAGRQPSAGPAPSAHPRRETAASARSLHLLPITTRHVTHRADAILTLP